MVELREVPFSTIQSFLWEFQKKSKCFEMPPEEAEFFGIYKDNQLIGYFILVGYNNEWVEINQGYLKREFRHLDLAKDCIPLVEKLAKAAGYKEIYLGTHNRFRAYLKFMKQNGYSPEHLTFKKVL